MAGYKVDVCETSVGKQKGGTNHHLQGIIQPLIFKRLQLLRRISPSLVI